MDDITNPIKAFDFILQEAVPVDLAMGIDYDLTKYHNAQDIVSNALEERLKFKGFIQTLKDLNMFEFEIVENNHGIVKHMVSLKLRYRSISLDVPKEVYFMMKEVIESV